MNTPFLQHSSKYLCRDSKGPLTILSACFIGSLIFQDHPSPLKIWSFLSILNLCELVLSWDLIVI